MEQHQSQSAIPVFWLPRGGSVLTRTFRVIKTISALRTLGAPDVIRMRGFSLERALILLLLKWRKSDVPIVVQPAMLGGDDLAALSKKRFGDFQVRQLLKADAIFAMNVQIRDQFLEKGYPKEAIYPTRNAVALQYFGEYASEERLAVRKGLGIPEDAVVVATVGVILPRKRQAFVTEGFCAALAECGGENKVLVHVGPGATDRLMAGRPDQFGESRSEEEAVARIASQFERSASVSLLGEREDIATLLGAVDILVHASTEEGEANVVNEAAAAGVVVVVPTSSVYDDQLPEAYPWRFDDRSARDLALLLARLMTDSSLREEAGRALREHARQHRCEEVVGKRYAEILRAVVERHRWGGTHSDR